MNFLKSDNYLGSFSQLWILPLQHYKGIGYNATTGYFTKGLKNYLVQLPFSMDTAEWKVKRKKGIYTVALQCFFKGADEATLTQLAQLENSPFLVVIQDHNNNYVLMGDNANFFLFDHNFESGKDFSDVAGTEIKLERDMMRPPIFITTPFVNTPPLAKAVGIVGNKTIGQTITGTYSFYDDDNEAEASHQFKWYLADNNMGINPVVISGETGQTLTIDAAWLGMYILFSVVVSDGMASSAETFSPVYIITEIAINNPPQALAVAINGNVKAGETVTGSYTYYDEDEDQEYGSIYAWYISDNANGLPKTKLSSTTNTCSIDPRAAGKYLQFSVMPVNAVGVGHESFSPFYQIAPAIIDIIADMVLDFGYSVESSFDDETKILTVTTINPDAPFRRFRVSAANNFGPLPPMTRLNFSFKVKVISNLYYGTNLILLGANPKREISKSEFVFTSENIPVVNEWINYYGYASSPEAIVNIGIIDSIHLETRDLPAGVTYQFKDLEMHYNG